ncbi:nitrile hydratase accessory protein [Enemella dayhoffiae]|uniref:Nitrile hydratase accessory protein n=2 Tax=Enemella dayhoffiae TaxID=2016507 RepID=A0A255GRE0_9ACTN|nr:nitrile hydratase accessory protein [Enemella dayhoffiae]
MPLPPAAGDKTVFAEPWQAQVFAITVALHERGVFDWPEWADRLGRELKQSTDSDGSDYYLRWTDALLGLLADRGLVTADELVRTERAWHEAAARTLHGRPISLS